MVVYNIWCGKVVFILVTKLQIQCSDTHVVPFQSRTTRHHGGCTEGRSSGHPSLRLQRSATGVLPSGDGVRHHLHQDHVLARGGQSPGSRILVRGALRSLDPKGGLSPKFAQNGVFPLKLPENCMIEKKSWRQGDPLVMA